MAYGLLFDGVDDYCSLPSAVNVNIGLDAWVFEVEAGFTSTNASGGCVLGGALSTANDGFQLLTTGRLNVLSGSTNRITCNSGYVMFDGVVRKYRIEHDSSGAFRFYRDGSLTQSGTYTGNFTFNGGLGVIGRYRVSTAWSVGMNFRKLTLTGFSSSAEWDANLSGGAGSTLPTVSGTNQGTLVNFTVPDCWIFYSSGAYDITAQGGTYSYAGASAGLNAARTIEANGGTYSYTGASASISINRQVDAIGATYSYSGASANVSYNRFIAALGDTFSYSGASASLTYETATAFNLTALGGSFAYSGANAELTYVQINSYLLTALGATYSYQGAQASLTATGVIPQANPSAFVISAYIGGIETVKASVGGVARINAIIDSRLTINARLSQ